MEQNNKKKSSQLLKKAKKTGIVIGIIAAAFLALALACFGVIIYRGMSHPASPDPKQQNDASASAAAAAQNNETENEYIDVPFLDEKHTYGTASSGTEVCLSDDAYMRMTKELDTQNSVFRLAEYYGLDDALDLYGKTQVNKRTETNLLTDGQLDADKLVQTVTRNNSAVTSNGKNTLNAFYTELNSSEITAICGEIADVINDRSRDFDIKKAANTLEKLTMFQRTGTTSNAYVSTELSFVYNPNSTYVYETMQEMTGSSADNAREQVIIHEIMHLIQYGASDNDETNGIETGFCRMYNTPSGEKKIPVDSLYYSWLLEAGAELGMADYLEIEPFTYQKKISYVTSYNLSRFYENGIRKNALENVVFRHTLEDALNALRIKSEDEKNEFLSFMYSIEIIQTNPEVFFEYYESQTNQSLTDEEKTGIRMDIRTDAVKYLSIEFFENIINAVHDGAITDLDTVFYLMRLWELDVFNHLNYTQMSSFESAEDFIVWYNQMQDAIFTAVAKSSHLDPDQVQTLYAEYHLQSEKENKELTDNCNLKGMNDYIKNYILSAKQSYQTLRFCTIHDVAEWIKKDL